MKGFRGPLIGHVYAARAVRWISTEGVKQKNGRAKNGCAINAHRVDVEAIVEAIVATINARVVDVDGIDDVDGLDLS